MKPGIVERHPDPAPRPGEPSSQNQPENGAVRDEGFVGVESPTAADAVSFAGVRVRH